MLTLLFFITTVVCAMGWLVYWVTTSALAKYMRDKGYVPPSAEELKAYCSYVCKKLFHIQN